MAALPSPTQVAGSHNAIYEAYYNVVDPNGYGSVGGMEAARFLKRSGLSDVILSKIWDLSDPGGRGSLDKSGMFVALKLVALVQNGNDLNIKNVNVDVPPPKMGDIPLPKPVKPPPPSSNSPLITSLPPTAVDWTVKPSERDKYERLFESLQPAGGLLQGNKVKSVLMESKLPLETLGRIWDLADQDKDGMLDRHEFIVAMHLVYKALDKYAIPNNLPPELLPPAKTKVTPPGMVDSFALSRGLDGVKPPGVPPPPVSVAAVAVPLAANAVAPPKPAAAVAPQQAWVVTPEEKAKSDSLFIKSDIDKDGFVSGQEIKDVFLQSGVPQPILAHIWGLCDIKQSGKLNNEQFALAMWFVARCLKDIEPPQTLLPEMVPPSFRTSKPAADGLVENNNTRYSNPELDMISKDIEELAREKLGLETDIAQKEADVRVKSGEIKSLQSELDTLAATLKQLENQKGEAQKRLNDLKTQRHEIGLEMEMVDRELEAVSGRVEKLRLQAVDQSETLRSAESELNLKKEQLEGLRQEEMRLERQKTENANKLQSLTNNLQDTQLNISQAKNLISQLQEQTRQMNDAIQACDTAIESGDTIAVPDTALRITPEFRDDEYKKIGLTNGRQNGFSDTTNDPFTSNGSANRTAGFGSEDLFKNDPFKNSDAFGSSDAFNSPFPKNDGFASDPFGGSSFGNDTATKQDPFVDAFGDSRKGSDATAEPNKDPFGCDPFAVLHAPTRDGSVPPGRPTSPSPALPPKKSKQPPPRPAPPRPMAPPVSKKQDMFDSPVNDPFASSGGGGFADFSDFDSKFSNNNINKPTTTSMTATSDKVVAAAAQQRQPKGLEFTDDPFRDYRYEDPFNISFDDDDNANAPPPPASNSNSHLDTNANANAGFPSADKFDPFGLVDNNAGGRQSVPLSVAGGVASVPYGAVSGRASAPIGGGLGRGRAATPSEDQQLAWAAHDSLKLEEERRRRQMQEQADLELAIRLSKAENRRR